MFSILGDGRFWLGAIVGALVGGAIIHKFVTPLVGASN